MTSTDPSAAIRALGHALGPEVLARCRELFDARQAALAGEVPVELRDAAYGPHPRQRLDLYGTPGAAARPVLLFVHGGGFVAGDKGGGSGWGNAHVGRWAARAGMVGGVMNYRLAPEHGWPAGAADVAAAVEWLIENVADHGGDPARIFAMGHSAGAVHVAGALQLQADLAERLRGAVLLSGFYGYTSLDREDERYYGDAELYAEHMPREAMAATRLPLFLACAEFDPARFQAEFLGLMAERLERHGAMPRGYIASGHNHYSLAMHLGMSDRRLADEITGFLAQCD